MSNTRPIALLLAAVWLAIPGCSPSAGTAANQQTTVPTAPVPAADTSQWPLFRGDPAGQGVAQTALPEKPQLLWKYKLPDTAFEAAAVIFGDTVYIGDGDREFHALALSDGSVRWSTPIDQGFRAAAAVRDGRVYAGDAGGVFHCFDAKTGRELWNHPTKGEINSSPNLFEDSVIFASQDGSLYRLRGADGKLIWKYSIKADGGIQSSPTISGDHVLFAGCDGSMHVLNLKSGERVSNLNLSDMTLATPAIVDSHAYLGMEGGDFLAVDWQQPKILWRYRNPRSDAGYRASAAVSTDWVIIGGRSKSVTRLDPKKGEPMWNFNTGGRVDSSPVVAGGRIYFGSADGRVYCVRLDDGKPVWKHNTGGGIMAAPAVAQGRLVIGNENGVLYCFGSERVGASPR